MKRSVWIGMVLILAATGCATTPQGPWSELTIESDPPQALILKGAEMDGPWEEYLREKGLHVTPSTSKVPQDAFFWVKLAKKGYRDSEPFFVRMTPGEPNRVTIILEEAGDVAEVFVESEPQGATVLVAESIDGDYRPWPEAEGEPITPAKGLMPVGDAFWLKVSKDDFKDSIPEYIHIESTIPKHLVFDLAKRKRKVESAAKSTLTITSNPSQATILASDAEHGAYIPWPPQEDMQLTPFQGEINIGETFWLKLRKDGYVTTEPRVVSITESEPSALHFDLKPVEKRVVPEHKAADPRESGGAPPPEVQPRVSKPEQGPGIIAMGFAKVEGSEAQARNMAILDGLGVAIQQKYGAQITAGGVAKNYSLMANRLEATVAGKYASYDVLEELVKNGVYRVKLRVLFKGDVLKAIHGENVSFLVGGREKIYYKDERIESKEARRAAADALMAASIRVTVEDQDYTGVNDLAKRAEETRSDLVLHMAARADLNDEFGQFVSFKSAIDYSLVIPVSGDIITTGTIEGYNEKSQLNARDAYNHCLRDTGAKVAQAALQKLAERYDQSASYDVYVWNVPDQRTADTIAKELRTISGVREARLFAYDGENCVFNLIISPDARTSMADAVQRLRNVDLDVLESNPYDTVAQMR